MSGLKSKMDQLVLVLTKMFYSRLASVTFMFTHSSSLRVLVKLVLHTIFFFFQYRLLLLETEVVCGFVSQDVRRRFIFYAFCLVDTKSCIGSSVTAINI